MSDGTVLRVDEFYPTTSSRAAAKGPFPALLTQVPYGNSTPADDSYYNPYLVQPARPRSCPTTREHKLPGSPSVQSQLGVSERLGDSLRPQRTIPSSACWEG